MVAVTEYRNVKKGDFIVHTGQVLNEVYFMEEGVSRGYFINTNGNDVTDCFSFSCGSTSMPFCQLELGIPSPMEIQILEDSKFFCVPISDLMEFQDKYPEFVRFYNRLLIKALNEHWRLKQVLSQYTAIQRYKWFLEEYPGLIDRISNKYIASFIGMTPVTLSRLRRVLRENQRNEKERKD